MIYLGNNTAIENTESVEQQDQLIFPDGEISFSVEYPGHEDIVQLLGAFICSFYECTFQRLGESICLCIYKES